MDKKSNENDAAQSESKTKEELLELIKKLDVSLLVNNAFNPYDNKSTHTVRYKKVEDMF